MKIIKVLFSPVFMAIMMVILAVALAAATFIENGYGTMAARGMIYNARWLELVWLLLAVNLTGQIFRYKLYRREKFTVMLFHLAFILMLAGAALTRYTGIEGTMHIREGASSDEVSSVRPVKLPFTVSLDDFIVERYPGSMSPSGFKSIVTVTGRDAGSSFRHEIYMNHILKYKGYRFFQSSYDEDEMGTVLSVNHDPAGMAVTYTGYGLLFIFIILSVINRKSFFRTVTAGYWCQAAVKRTLAVVLMLGSAVVAQAQPRQYIPDRQAAEQFGSVLVQDEKGRTKPLSTLSSDICRKVTKDNGFGSLTPMQVFMGYSFDFENWQHVPLVKVNDRQLQKMLGLESSYASFSDIVTLGEVSTYRLAPLIERAYSKPASARTRFDKEVIKVDERLNICFMMGTGDFLRIFPVNDTSDRWVTAAGADTTVADKTDSLFISSFLPQWAAATGAGADRLTESMKGYQRDRSSYRLPSPFNIRCEIFYNNARLFEKLFPFYAMAGLLMLIVLVAGIITGSERNTLLSKIMLALVVAGFFFHTAGIGLRWYISGHSPMSNGYESMLFVSWVLMVAGILFSRRSLMPLAATTLMAGMTLMVAHLSFMDPEITNLMPVLRSYWLTLHVSVITGSYAFLGLGALMGLINMIMYLPANERNRERIVAATGQLTVINYQSLTLGLYMLTIGTFLGAVWANESWGRYWGWDPKETWSLITIIVYTLVTHMRNIPAMRDVYLFNLFSVVAFSSVLMTYFGVNYYLAGMHSYASGGAAPLSQGLLLPLLLFVLLAMASGFMYLRTSRPERE